MLKIIQETIEATRIQMDFEEAAILWPKIQEFVKTHNRQPDINSIIETEKRMAECIIYLKKKGVKRQQIMRDKESILKEIFENDPFGLLIVKPKKSAARTSDERLAASLIILMTLSKKMIENQSQTQLIFQNTSYILHSKG